MPRPLVLSEMRLYEYATEHPIEWEKYRTTTTHCTLMWTQREFPHRAFELLSDFPHLVQIDFELPPDNELEPFVLPESLTELRLSGGLLHRLDAHFWQTAHRLLRLTLHCAPLQPLLFSGDALPHLQYLEIKMRLEELPDGVWDLVNLKELVLNFNTLGNIPDRIGNLKQLERLAIRKNNLKSIEALTQLSQLKELDVTGNRLIELPNELDQWQELERLELAANRLSALPAGFANLKKLQYLDAGFNKFTQFPEAIFSLNVLEELKLENNLIEIIPTEIAQLTALKTLHLKSNPVHALPPSLLQLRQLERLDLSMDRKAQVQFFSDHYAIFHLPNIHNVHIFGGELHGRNIPLTQAFVKAIYKFNPPSNVVKDLISIYFQQEIELASVPNSSFSYALTVGIKFPELGIWCVEQLVRRTAERAANSPLAPGARVAILGSSSLRPEHLIAQLEALGLQGSTEADEQTTHIVLCLGGHGNIHSRAFYDKETIIFLTEHQLIAFLEQHDLLYLKQATAAEQMDEGMVSHIRSLLLSNDEANLSVAFELMHSGGVPTALLEELLILSQYSRFSFAQKQSTDLLLAYGSERLKHNLLNRKNIKKKTTFLLKDIAEGTELVWWKIERYLVLNNQIETACRAIPDDFFANLLKSLPDDAMRHDLLTQLLKNKIKTNQTPYPCLSIFNIPYIIDLKMIMPHIEAHPELQAARIGETIRGLNPALIELLDRHPAWHEFDLNTDETLDWWALFSPQSHIRKLNLRIPHESAGDYSFLMHLSHLKELTLWIKSKEMVAYPPLLFQLKQLEKLELFDYHHQYFSVCWQDFQFPELRELHLNNIQVDFNEIPDLLAGMPKLELISMLVKITGWGSAHHEFYQWEQAIEARLREQNWQGKLDISRTW